MNYDLVYHTYKVMLIFNYDKIEGHALVNSATLSYEKHTFFLDHNKAITTLICLILIQMFVMHVILKFKKKE